MSEADIGSIDGVPPDFAGWPDKPDPWTTGAAREGLRDNGEALIVSLSPSVRSTPSGGGHVAVPYPVWDECDHMENYSSNTFYTGQRVLRFCSWTSHAHGTDVAGEGGPCEPIDHASKVRVEGSEVVRHLDRFWMDDRRTVGEALFVRDMALHPAPSDDDPLPGSARAMAAGTATAVQLAQAQPTPQPYRPAPPPDLPARPPGLPDNVIRGPWQPRPPPELPEPPPGFWPQLWRYGRWGVLLLPLLLSGDTPQIPPPSAEEYKDKTVRDLYNTAVGKLTPFDEDYNTKVKQWYQEELQRYRLYRKQQDEARSQPAPAPVPQSDPVRVSEEEERKRKCIVGRYNDIRNLCPPGSQAHHIVPDYTLRYGSRAEGAAGLKRIPNMPSFGDGPSICLTGSVGMEDSEHNEAHRADQDIARLGAQGNPVDTAPISDVRKNAVDAVARIRPDCALLIYTTTMAAFTSVDPSQLARTRKAPLPSGQTLEALQTGAKAR